MAKGEMKYSDFVEVYEELYATTKRLEKETILAGFLKKLAKEGEPEWIYLLRGKVTPDYDDRILGLSDKLAMKAIGKTFGIKDEEIAKRYRKIGDIGELAEEFAGRKRQTSLFARKLTVEKVFSNLRKVMEVEGKGAVTGKTALISELLGNASGKEAKYIVRMLVGQLRVGVADATLREAIAEALFPEEKQEMGKKLEVAYDMANDFAIVFEAASKGKKELDKIDIVVGRPMNVMLPVKVTEIGEAFRICGKPAAIEHKYDGFRVVINKIGNDVKLFTRRLENVTNQFPDVVQTIKKFIKAKEVILDSEVVGYEPKTKRQRPFEAISQRIKRKYDIEKLEKELPVEVNVFDIIYHNGESLMQKPFSERRKVLEKIIPYEKWKIRLSMQIVTDSEEVALKFYNEALKAGEEGIMIKNLNAGYQQGRRVGYIVKMKPAANDLDFVITGAEYGSGKRGGMLTSYIVACREGEKYLEVGKVSSGLKELEQEGGTTYEEMTALLKPLIESEKGKVVKVKPKIIVSVTYQNIQGSPSYDSGFAMRFPRITNYRPDYHLKDIATLDDIKMEVEKAKKGMSHLG
ncbi:ATP-dependent DNA ligase [Candidatus Pacearchaeota archaeon]|nr:ATP-dependent DNA ligase [Candidatus Pacearchaeota archaeon]